MLQIMIICNEEFGRKVVLVIKSFIWKIYGRNSNGGDIEKHYVWDMSTLWCVLYSSFAATYRNVTY